MCERARTAQLLSSREPLRLSEVWNLGQKCNSEKGFDCRMVVGQTGMRITLQCCDGGESFSVLVGAGLQTWSKGLYLVIPLSVHIWGAFIHPPIVCPQEERGAGFQFHF